MNKQTGRKVLAIIDGKSVFYRGYYAMPNLSKKDGTPTGGVYGFAAMALEVIRKLDPDYVCVAWDKPKTNIRRRIEMYPAYKAGRKPPPADFYEQIPLLHKLLEAFGWPLYELDDYEADDIMGSLAAKAKKKDIETMLISSDLDMLQVINTHTHMYALKKGLTNIDLYSPEFFTEKYGIRPDQFLDLKALKGDSSDNIPGVPGIGEKGAIELLKQYETLDGVYENIELIKDSLKKKLVAGKDSAYLSKKLAALWLDAPIDLELKKLDMANCDTNRVKQVLQELEFSSLVRRLPEVMQVTASEEKTEVRKNGLKSSDLDVFKTAHDLGPVDGQDTYFVLPAYADKQKRTITHLAIANEQGKGSIISADKLEKPDTQKALAALKGKEVVTYDAKALVKHFWEWNDDIAKPFDVLIAAFLLNSLTRDQSLAGLAREWLDLEIELLPPGSSSGSRSPVSGQNRPNSRQRADGHASSNSANSDSKSGNLALEENPEAGARAEDRDELEQLRVEMAVMQKLYGLFKKELAKKDNHKLKALFDDVEMPLTPVLAGMEREGIQLDTDEITRIDDQVSDLISDYEQQIYGYADTEFNIGSPAQLADILFEKLQLPKEGIKKGKTGFSTAASELDKLRGIHPIIDLITHWREVTKLKNTYIDTLPTMVDENSRLHTTYDLTVAATGRLSSNDPNLQNIPVRTELGKQIRTAFVADKGNMLVSADYSQQELRLAAYLADDKELIDMFNRDVDVHTATAAEVYGRDPEDVTKNMRRDAKVVNFGIMYGLSTHGLVAATGMTYEQAKNFIKKYFEVRPKLVEYIDKVKEQAKTDGYTETIMGRRRPTPDVHSSNFMVREAAMRQAVNMPFQGSAADIMKLAMVRVQHVLDQFTVDGEQLTEKDHPKILLQIHDSLIIECREQDAEKVAKTVKETMEEAYKLPVKLTVDTSVGKNWGEL